jgi:membrane-bound serine protease (ClpP class)
MDKIVTTLTVLWRSPPLGVSRVLPRTPVYHNLVSQSASGEASVVVQARQQSKRIGELGLAVSVLRPGGKAKFGDQIIDVISQGEMIPKGTRVKVIGHSGSEAIVEAVT